MLDANPETALMLDTVSLAVGEDSQVASVEAIMIISHFCRLSNMLYSAFDVLLFSECMISWSN